MLELQTLLFVSRSLIVEGEEDAEIEDLLRVGRSRNHHLGVTGALIFTGRYFAEVLEGSPASLDTLMKSIEADPRHTELNIVERHAIARRIFNGWNMAYRGPAAFVSKRIEALLEGVDKHMATQLSLIFQEFLMPG